jgi:5-methylcytosine-specific restriction protein B
MSYCNELLKFIAQAKTGELTISKYINEYEGLKVKVSFGQGNQARIPWIAFLAEGNTVQHGIYPVYLFFKEKNLLLLSYGVSETLEPVNNWPNNKKLETINEYFRKNELGKPERFGNSFVYIAYDVTKPINEYQVNENLKSIISKYKTVLEKNNITSMKNVSFNYKTFQKKCADAGLQFSDKMILRFVSTLCAKPFVICTGLSGSGKTKLAQSFAHWICSDEQQYKIITINRLNN